MMPALFGRFAGGWIVYAIFAAIIVATLGYTYHLGHSSATAKWEAKYARREAEIANQVNAEINRVQQANALAKASEAKRLAELATENAALEQKIKEMSDAADADPDRDRPALSPDSGMRIDSIR